MNRSHPDIGPEIRKLAQAIVDGIEPGVRAAAALAAASGPGTGSCQQVWCPLCALAAVVTGEQHPLLTIVAEHSVVLVEAVRLLLGEIDKSPPSTSADGSAGGGAVVDTSSDEASGRTRYQPIPVTFDE